MSLIERYLKRKTIASPIQGIRRSTNSQYSIFESLVKPEWGFPGGALQPFLDAAETFSQYFRRINNTVYRPFKAGLTHGDGALENLYMRVHGSTKDLTKGTMGAYDLMGREAAIRIPKGVSINEIINPNIEQHRQVLSTVRHETTHMLQYRAGMPRDAQDDIFDAVQRAEKRGEANSFDRIFQSHNKIRSRVFNLPNGQKWDTSEVAAIEAYTESSSMMVNASMYKNAQFLHEGGYGITRDEIRSLLDNDAVTLNYIGFRPENVAKLASSHGREIPHRIIKIPDLSANTPSSSASSPTLGLVFSLHDNATGNSVTRRLAKRGGPINTINKSRHARYSK